MISGLPPAPYLEHQPSQAALEQNSLEYLMSLAQLEVNSVNSLLEQSEMYQDGNTASNTLTPPMPQGSITPVTMAKGFHPIGRTPPVSPATQLTQVSHTQALNLLESQVATETIVQKLTPVNLVDQSMAQPSSSTSLTQEQPVKLVSFASTTQIRMDTVVHPPVSQMPPQVLPLWVLLSQITSVASTSNMASSLTSHQTEMLATSQNQQWTELQCRKSAKKNHSTTHCCKKVTCKQCKGNVIER